MEKETTMATEVAEETTKVYEATEVSEEAIEDKELHQETDEVRIDSETDDFDFDFPYSNSWGSEETENQKHKKPTGLHAPKVRKEAKKDALRILGKALQNTKRIVALSIILVLLVVAIVTIVTMPSMPSMLAYILVCFSSILGGVVIFLLKISFHPYSWEIFYRLTSLNFDLLEQLLDSSMCEADELAGATHREQVKDYIYYLVLKAEIASSAWKNFDPNSED